MENFYQVFLLQVIKVGFVLVFKLKNIVFMSSRKA